MPFTLIFKAVIVDPGAGFVTGGGSFTSPPGAYVAAPDATDKVTFSFVSQYEIGRSTPDGNTQFVFHGTNPPFNFRSTSYEWLVVTGSDCAKFKGEGIVRQHEATFGFMLTACDNGEPGNSDSIRVKIWNKSEDSTVYDNKMGVSNESYDGTALDHGNIQIHQQEGGRKHLRP